MLLGLGVALFDFNSSTSSSLPIADEEQLYFEKFRIKNTVFEITEKDNQFSVLKADEVEEKNAGEKIYDLKKPDAQTFDNGKVITLKSIHGSYDQNKKLLYLSNKVEADYNKQLLIKTETITYNFSSESGFGNNKILGTGDKGSFVSDRFTFNKKGGTITLIGNVEIYDDTIKLTTPDKATLYSNDNKMVAHNAIVLKGKDKLKGDTLTIYFKDNKNFEIEKALSVGNTEIHSDGKIAFADRGEYLADKKLTYLYDNVKIKDGNGYTALAENAVYDFSKKDFTLNNKVKIVKQNNTATADKAIYYQNKDEFHFFGNVKINQQGTTVSAKKGIYFVKRNVVELFNDVVITKNGNIVRGDKAVSDFNTSKSKLIAQRGGRISGKLIESKLKD
jgi:LPS export ABC transporter protein LptC